MAAGDIGPRQPAGRLEAGEGGADREDDQAPAGDDDVGDALVTAAVVTLKPQRWGR
jgi:hypothetical protein